MTAFPAARYPRFVAICWHSARIVGPPARWIALSTPPLPVNDEFAALTIATVPCFVMSAGPHNSIAFPSSTENRNAQSLPESSNKSKTIPFNAEIPFSDCSARAVFPQVGQAGTCARLCHASGGELEQIRFLSGHVSVQTTERYLGCKPRIRPAVNDRTLRNLTEPPVVDFNAGGRAAHPSWCVRDAFTSAVLAAPMKI